MLSTGSKWLVAAATTGATECFRLVPIVPALLHRVRDFVVGAVCCCSLVAPVFAGVFSLLLLRLLLVLPSIGLRMYEPILLGIFAY